MQSSTHPFRHQGFPDGKSTRHHFFLRKRIHPQTGCRPILHSECGYAEVCTLRIAFGKNRRCGVCELMNSYCDELADDQKLRLLQAAGAGRGWVSLEETRRCVLCERTFSGREAQVVWSRSGEPRLRCPTQGCRAKPSQWIHPGNPLTSEEAWRDWVRLLDTLCDESVHC